jgi:hypothetical protein
MKKKREVVDPKKSKDNREDREVQKRIEMASAGIEEVLKKYDVAIMPVLDFNMTGITPGVRLVNIKGNGS